MAGDGHRQPGVDGVRNGQANPQKIGSG
jgi:hypothetical protein